MLRSVAHRPGIAKQVPARRTWCGAVRNGARGSSFCIGAGGAPSAAA